MSLFYSPREVRIINTKKRKKTAATNEFNIEVQEMYSCNWCTDEYDSETELHFHKQSKHRQDISNILLQDIACKICLSEHENPEELLKHIKSAHLFSSDDAQHVHREIFICDICSLLYFNKAMLELHMQQKHKPENKGKLYGTCPKCNKKIRIRHIWFHFRGHLIQSVACCPICLTKCKNLGDLHEHMKKHPNYYHCTICGYDTKAEKNFSTHMQAHDSNLNSSRNIAIDEGLLWRCFAPRPEMKTRRSSIFGVKGLTLFGVYVCVLCRGLCKEDERAAHIARYHLVNIVASKKQYKCACGEQFFNNVLLKHHVFKMQGNHKALN